MNLSWWVSTLNVRLCMLIQYKEGTSCIPVTCNYHQNVCYKIQNGNGECVNETTTDQRSENNQRPLKGLQHSEKYRTGSGLQLAPYSYNNLEANFCHQSHKRYLIKHMFLSDILTQSNRIVPAKDYLQRINLTTVLTSKRT